MVLSTEAGILTFTKIGCWLLVTEEKKVYKKKLEI